MLLQSLVKDKENSTRSARGYGPQGILSSLLKKDKKEINRLELLDDEESDENEDYYQPNNLSDETDCDFFFFLYAFFLRYQTSQRG